MKKSKLEAMVDTLKGMEDIINEMRLQLDDEELDDIAFDSLSSLERLKDNINIRIKYE